MQISLAVFFVLQLITFIRNKWQQKLYQTDVSARFFTPYLRIIPMHLTLLIPMILHISGVGVFLILRAIADISLYIITKPVSGGNLSGPAVSASGSNEES